MTLRESTITLQFRGIHPTIGLQDLMRAKYHYITVPGHPSDSDVYYVNETIMYHYITVPGHPSDAQSKAVDDLKMYHYITVPGHPSDLQDRWDALLSKVPLHYSSGASIRQNCDLESCSSSCTITLQSIRINFNFISNSG